MSNQKYYVKSKFWNGGQNYFTLDKSIITDSFWSIWINPKTFEAPQQQFTKSELTKIKGGAFYKQTWSLPFEWLGSSKSLKEELGWEYNETIGKFEYINPLIELVPVEEEV